MPNREIVIKSKHCFPYAPKSAFKPPLSIRQSASFLLRAPSHQTILPGESITLPAPEGLVNNTRIAIEPRSDTGDTSWITPCVTESVAGIIHIPNTTSEPVRILKHQHLAQAYYMLFYIREFIPWVGFEPMFMVLHGRCTDLLADALTD